VTTDGIRQSWI